MALDDQRFKDHCLIVVGAGGKADEVLCQRRLQAGGRLAHFLMLRRSLKSLPGLVSSGVQGIPKNHGKIHHLKKLGKSTNFRLGHGFQFANCKRLPGRVNPMKLPVNPTKPPLDHFLGDLYPWSSWVKNGYPLVIKRGNFSHPRGGLNGKSAMGDFQLLSLIARE